MNVQVIKDRMGRDEYVLLPVRVYEALREEIGEQLEALELLADAHGEEAFTPFDPADFVKNPVALARMRAGIKQVELARRLGVTQSYLSKLESAKRVSKEAMEKVMAALQTMR